MRICDWSSDVCSSDLIPADPAAPEHARRRRALAGEHLDPGDLIELRSEHRGHQIVDAERGIDEGFDGRSEEHTSELQSLMRISYAVFCLKKKKQNHISHLNSCNFLS